MTPERTKAIQARVRVLAAAARVAADKAWKLESALSMYRKACAGYRASVKTGDQPWNPADYEAKLEAAFLESFGP